MLFRSIPTLPAQFFRRRRWKCSSPPHPSYPAKATHPGPSLHQSQANQVINFIHPPAPIPPHPPPRISTISTQLITSQLPLGHLPATTTLPKQTIVAITGSYSRWRSFFCFYGHQAVGLVFSLPRGVSWLYGAYKRNAAYSSGWSEMRVNPENLGGGVCSWVFDGT